MTLATENWSQMQAVAQKKKKEQKLRLVVPSLLEILNFAFVDKYSLEQYPAESWN